jgi:hypothetical protein
MSKGGYIHGKGNKRSVVVDDSCTCRRRRLELEINLLCRPELELCQPKENKQWTDFL